MSGKCTRNEEIVEEFGKSVHKNRRGRVNSLPTETRMRVIHPKTKLICGLAEKSDLITGRIFQRPVVLNCIRCIISEV